MSKKVDGKNLTEKVADCYDGDSSHEFSRGVRRILPCYISYYSFFLQQLEYIAVNRVNNSQPADAISEI